MSTILRWMFWLALTSKSVLCTLSTPDCLFHFSDATAANESLVLGHQAVSIGQQVVTVRGVGLGRCPLGDATKCLVSIVRILQEGDLWQAMEQMQLVRAKKKLIVALADSVNGTTIEELGARKHNFDVAVLSGLTGEGWIKQKHQRGVVYKDSGGGGGQEPVLSWSDLEAGEAAVKRVDVASFLFRPFYQNSHADPFRMTGIDAEMWQVISKRLAVSLEYKWAKDMVGTANMVRQGLADVNGVQLIFNTLWTPGLDLSPAMYLRELFLVAKFPKVKNRSQALVELFDVTVWIATGLSLLAMILALLLLRRVLSWDSGGGGGRADLFLLISMSLGVVINEGLPHRALSVTNVPVSKQLLLWTWLPSACLLGMAYQSNLLAALVEVETERPIDHYQDILDRDLTLYLQEGVLVPYLMATSPFALVRQVFKKAHVDRNGNYRFENGELPFRVKASLLSGRGVLSSTTIRTSGTPMRRGKELLVGGFHCGYYFAMNHPLQKQVAGVVRAFLEAGCYQQSVDRFIRIRQREENYMKRRERDKILEAKAWKALEVGHMAPVFIFAAVALILSSVSLALERAWTLVE